MGGKKQHYRANLSLQLMWNSNIKWIYNKTGSGQSKVFTPVRLILTQALLATLKKVCVSCMRKFWDQHLIKKNYENAPGDFYVVTKRTIWLKLTFSSLFQHAHHKSLTCFKDANLRYSTENFKTPNILHVVFCNLLQIDVTKILGPFQAMMNF